MLKMLKRIAAGLLAAMLVVGILYHPAEVDAATKKLKTPGNCHFVKWNNKSFTSCRIAWNKVSGANIYGVSVTWTDGSHEIYTETSKTYCDIKGLKNNHVYQAKVIAGYYNSKVGRITRISGWSNIAFITPSPTSCSVSIADQKNNFIKFKWNAIYGSDGYNIFLTTNPTGTWVWNQSTATKATANTAVIKKYRGSKLKKYQNYYYRIVTRRKRNGVFCTVPMPSSSYYLNAFYIYTTYYKK